MSDSWLEFDPLSRAKAKPAQPIMSMEQAEVRPSSSRSQDTDPSLLGNHSSSIEQDSQGNTKTHKINTPKPSEPTNRDEESSSLESSQQQGKTTPEEERDAHSESPNNDPTPQAESSESPQQPVEAGSKDPSGLRDSKPSVEPTDQPDQESNPDAESEDEKLALKGKDNEQQKALNDEGLSEIQMSDNRPIESAAAAAAASAANADGDLKRGSEDTWPPKLDLNSTANEGTHAGDLRKNSIAAMKELGAPLANLVEPSSEDDDSLPPFDFQKFMNSLRTKSADPIARYIKSFLQEFCRTVWTPKQQEKIVGDFHKFISVKLRDFEPFASMNRHERLNSLEGVEKLIMNRLYTRTFSPKIPSLLRTDGHTEDLLNDQVFEEKLRLWGWVEGRHLDINDEYLKSNFIHLATTEMGRLHQFKSPRDKMICILNCSKVIYALIRQAKLEQNADSFLPLLIYVVIKSHPVHLVSTINYIQRFRAKEFQRGETAYYLSTLASAVAFVQSLDQSSLTITAEEFEQRMTDAAQAEGRRKQQQLAESEMNEDNGHPHHEGESSAAVLTASAGMLVDRMKKMTSKFLEELANPESEANNDDPEQQQRRRRQQEQRSQNRTYRHEERAAREASNEEYRLEQAQREQFMETLETLQSMFPSLDRDLIEDVLRQNGTNVGSAVDICLALVG